MRSEDYADFVELLEDISITVPHQSGKDWASIGEKISLMYFEQLTEYDFGMVKAAIYACLRRDKFFPAISDIFKELQGTSEIRATLAWNLMLNAVRTLGSHRSVAFPSPDYNFVLRQMGGWIEFCASLRTDTVDIRGRSFERLFSFSENRASWTNEPYKIHVERYCAGRYEISNMRNNYALPEVYDVVTRQPIPGFRDTLPTFAYSHETGTAIAPLISQLLAGKKLVLDSCLNPSR